MRTFEYDITLISFMIRNVLITGCDFIVRFKCSFFGDFMMYSGFVIFRTTLNDC